MPSLFMTLLGPPCVYEFVMLCVAVVSPLTLHHGITLCEHTTVCSYQILGCCDEHSCMCHLMHTGFHFCKVYVYGIKPGHRVCAYPASVDISIQFSKVANSFYVMTIWRQEFQLLNILIKNFHFHLLKFLTFICKLIHCFIFNIISFGF